MWWLVAAAWAGDAEHDVAFQAARVAEREGRYADAVAACTRAIEIAPDGPRTVTCERRLGFLERRRDTDGSFAGWAVLEGVRERFRTTDPAEARIAVAQIGSSPTSSDVVRAEAAVWSARDALAANDPERALAFTGPVLDVPLPDDRSVATQVGELHAMALARLGRDEEAGRVEATVRVQVDPSAARLTPVEVIWRERRRSRVASGSGVAIGAFVLVSTPLALRAVRSGRFVPLGLVPIGLAAVTAGGLVYVRGPEVLGVLGWMVAAFVALHLLSAAALEGSGSAAVTGTVRVLAALATCGAAYLALWYTGTLMWVGF